MRTTSLSFLLRLLTLACSTILSTGKAAEVVPASLKTSVCEIATSPQDFDGKFVTLRATMLAGFEVFVLKDSARTDCRDIWLDIEERAPVVYLPFASLQPKQHRRTVHVVKDAAYERFIELLVPEMHVLSGRAYLENKQFEVTATFTGRLDHSRSRIGGFGHLAAHRTRLLLRSVEELVGRDLSATYNPRKYVTPRIEFPSGWIYGKVTGLDGKPVRGVDITARSIEDAPEFMRASAGHTDKRGRFRVAVPPGQYTVGVNTLYPISPEFPYRPVYYPGTMDAALADVITVRRGKRLRLDFRLREHLHTRNFLVRVQWPDGSPVQEAYAWLSEKEDPTSVVGMKMGRADDNGNVGLRGLKRFDYVLHARTYVLAGAVPHCAEPVEVNATDAIAELFGFA